VIGASLLAIVLFERMGHVTPSNGPTGHADSIGAATAVQPGTVPTGYTPPQQPDHLIPASQVQAPPTFVAGKHPPPPQVIEPPNPITHRPPMQNPGGVNGDRPPRVLAQSPQQPAPSLPETSDDQANGQR
jgi:hypothetical protein